MSTYTPIASQTISSAVPSITFSSIPQGYTDLIIVSSVAFNNTNDLVFRFNGDTSSSTLYSWSMVSGNGTSAVSGRTQNTSRGLADYNGFPTSTIGEHVAIMQIMNYSNSTTFKTTLSRGNSGVSGHGTDIVISLYRSTSPITSIMLGMDSAMTQNFVVGSTISIYGIAGGGVTAKASGGVVTTDATYAYHTFLSSGAFTPYEALTVDYLVVAGGGSGADTGGGHGAGGAGGLRSTVTATGGGGSLETALSLSSGISYPVIIGAGGAQPSVDGPGSNGSNSVFFNISSVGGGGGGGSGTGGLLGGSGGGGSRNSSAGGAGTTNQGYAGGSAGAEANAYGGGGGGGAGAVGANGTTGVGGNGGAGVAVAITGSSVTYAGGGGGGTNSSGFAAGTGGAGGGGNGSNGNAVAATSGTANTGGGGGGGSNGLSNNGNGGSGIVVIRYAL